MIRILFSFIVVITAFVFVRVTVAQDRGMKPVQITVEGKITTLYSQSHALLIGVCSYNEGLPTLPGVVDDIEAVKSALETNGFHVVSVMNPDNFLLERAFSDFIANYGQDANNRLLIYFAGHGYTEKMPYGDDIGYICPADAPDPNKNPAGFQVKAMPMRQIETYAYQIKSKHALFLFDACFSGSIFSTSRAIPEVISYKTKEPVRQFISSGSANETVPDKSIFRDQFIRALNGEADGNKDGYLSGTELGEFLQGNVVNYSYGSQHPQYGKIRNPNLDKGDFVFILNPITTKTTNSNSETSFSKDTKSHIQNGTLELTSQVSGDLYIDDNFIKKVNANDQLILTNITIGPHTIKIEGEEIIIKEFEVNPNLSSILMVERRIGGPISKPCPEMPSFQDPRDGQYYPTVQIGTQCWMQKNMNYDIGKSWCYDKFEGNCSIYGRLYDWKSALKACPEGWHLPSEEEWAWLIEFLGDTACAGGNMKETGSSYWKSPNTGASNISGFSARPSGYRFLGNYFSYINFSTYFWSSTATLPNYPVSIVLYNNRRGIFKINAHYGTGYSVRCIRD